VRRGGTHALRADAANDIASAAATNADCILSSNTSSIPITRIAAATSARASLPPPPKCSSSSTITTTAAATSRSSSRSRTRRRCNSSKS
jgi:hypothetical protein